MELHLSPETQERLGKLAQELGKDPAEIAEQALRNYVEEMTEYFAHVKQGLASIERGDVLEHEQVVADIERFLSE